MAGTRKQEVITFKVDEALWEALRGIPNRSEFIRNAILASLDSACPLCGGTGILSVHQKSHWEEFLGTHSLEECKECGELHMVCARTRRKPPKKK